MSGAIPTIVLVPASFSTPASFEPLKAELKTAGYSCISITLPSVNSSSQSTITAIDDAQAIRATLAPLAASGKDTVLVMHSYGGIPGTLSVEGFAKKDRISAGQPGGVISIIYLASHMLPVGQSLASAMAEAGGDPEWVHVDDNKMWMDAVPAGNAIYSDLSTTEAEAWGRKLGTHSLATFMTEVTYPVY